MPGAVSSPAEAGIHICFPVLGYDSGVKLELIPGTVAKPCAVRIVNISQKLVPARRRVADRNRDYVRITIGSMEQMETLVEELTALLEEL